MASPTDANDIWRKISLEAPEHSARWDRIQTMMVAVGQAVGVPAEELVAWRVLLARQWGGPQLSETNLADVTPQSFQQSLAAALRWNHLWENGCTDYATRLRFELGEAVDLRFIEACVSLSGVIQPVRM